ncbi:MAG: EF-hand domain-containing protein [Parasphingorhabdus sp.]|nr:EF-hand domain-containing protein [Parasphingorhabdus sp.]
MYRIFAATTALALAMPAIAQDSMPAPDADTAIAAPEASDGAAEQTTDNMAAPAETAQSAPADAPLNEDKAKNDPAAVTALVEQQFSTYDVDGSGDLNKEEFAKWVTTLREQSMKAQGATAAADPGEMTKWADNAFAAADTDKNSTISKPELSGFLMG